MRYLRTVFAILLLAAATHAQAQTPTPTPPETKVDASRGGITISSGVNSLTIGARMQFRWTLDDREEASADTAGAGLGAEDGVSSQFDIPRMRVSFSGGVFRPWLRYNFQYEFSRTSGESASKIKDALIEIRPTGRPFRVSIGQFKAPFGLQQLTSSGRLQFVDRAITDSKFNPSRDMGLMLSGSAAGRRLGYDVGLFNGSGESVRQNTRAHLWAARAYFQPFGTYALSEGSSDAPDRPVLHVGAGVRGGKQIRGRTSAGVFDRADSQNAFNLEFAVKASRLYATAEHFWMSDEQENPAVGPTIDSRGFHVQAGYMVVPRRVEVGLLHARITPDADEEDADVTETRAVVSYYWQAHSLKLQADAGRISFDDRFGAISSRARQGLPSLGTRLSSGRSFADTQVRVQMQVAF
jgi:phosphate-selective porin OprO and OprP